MVSRNSTPDVAQAWMRYAFAWGQMSMAASEVIYRRTLMMAQGSMSASEAIGMMMEKSTAFSSSMEKAAVAAARGADPAGIATAALRPIGIKARSNARRLRG